MKKLFTALTAILFLFAACNNNATNSGDPKQVLMKFFDALGSKDIPKARSLATKDSETMLNLVEQGIKMAPDSLRSNLMNPARMQFAAPVISGDDATVQVTDKVSAEAGTFSLKKESGAWKVVFDMTTLIQMGQNKMKEKGFDQRKIDKMMDEVKGAMDSNPDIKLIMRDTIK